MGRTRTAKAVATGLKERIAFSEKKKKELILYLQKLKHKYSQGTISYSRYIEIIYKKRDGKTIKQWIEYYNDYINNCEKLLRKQKRIILFNRSLMIFASLFILTFIFSNLSLIPNLIGLIIQDQSQEFTQTLNIELDESTIYQWRIDNPGKLNSLKISGLAELEKNGEVQVYIDGLLVLDTRKLRQSQIGITGAAIGSNNKNKFLNFFKKIIGFFSIAGKAVEDISTDSKDSSSDSSSSGEETSQEDSSPSQEKSSPPDETTSETSDSEETTIEEESPPKEDSSPSQEEIPPSETEEEPEIEVNETEIPENETKEESPEELEIPEEEKDDKIKETETITFTEICEETCDLSNLNLSKSSYTLRIEIKKAKLTINEIKYEILTEEEIQEEPKTNITDINITLPEENITVETITIGNITGNITTRQYKAIIGKPTKWIKTLNLENISDTSNLSVKIPKEATNISIKTGLEIQNSLNEIEEFDETIKKTSKKNLLSGVITGNVALDIKNEQGLFTRFWNFIKRIGVTGNVIEEQDLQTNIIETEDSKIIELGDIINKTQATEIAIEYYTLGPKSYEENTSSGKRVIVSGNEKLNYTNILTFTEIPEIFNIGQENQIKILWKEENKYIEFTAYDTNNNEKLDYLEWITPHLSNQTFEIILIIKAEHLDQNKIFISDIYEEVKELDGNWSETIPDTHYIRITFETNLTKNRDITLYPRIVNITNNETPKIQVYEFNQSVLIAEFTNITNNTYNKVLLTNLISDSQDVFDLRILYGDIQFDHLIDPVAVPEPGAGQTTLRPRTCEGLDRENSDEWGVDACDGNYPDDICGTGDDLVSCDDDFRETMGATGDGFGNQYGGIRTNYSNSSVTGCSSIDEVSVCYEWWFVTGSVQNCRITISNGTTENTITTTCPGSTANPGISCLNVTANLTWQCDNFFGFSASQNESYIESEIQGASEFVTSIGNWDALYYNVSYTSSELFAPTVTLSSPADNTVSPNTTYNFQCNVTDDFNIANTTIYIYNETNDIWNTTINTSTGTSLNYTFSISGFETNNTYLWNCLSYDNDSLSKWASNFTLNVTLAPNINLLTPADNAISTSYSNTLVCNVSDERGIVNVSFWTNWSNVWHEVELNDSGLNEVNYSYTSDLRYDYKNQTDGFNPDGIGIDPYGIATNGSDFWILDSVDGFVYHLNSSKDNQTDGFSVFVGDSSPWGLTTNGSDFWVAGISSSFIYHFNSSGDNQTDGFSTVGAGSTSPKGIATNGSDFWVVDDTDRFVYHFDSSGNNITDGFDTSGAGSASPNGITTNGSDFWVLDTVDDFIYHFNSSGDNQTDGFSTKALSSGMTFITSYTEITPGFPLDFWLTDINSVYHIGSSADGKYLWTCQACGTMGACNTSVTNFTLEIAVINIAPTHSAPIFSPSNPKTSDDLTCINQSTSDSNGDNVTNIYNWLVDGDSITLLNLPFDTNISDTTNNAVRDYSGNNNHGTLGGGSNTPTWNPNCKIGGCYDYDGDDLLSILDNDIFDNQGFTLTAWINMSAVTTTSTIFKKDDQFILRIHGATDDKLYGYLKTNIGFNPIASSSALVSDKWYHVAYVVNATDHSLYIDGVLNATETDTDTRIFSVNSITIGDDSGGGEAFNGKIDEAIYWNRSLSSSQIYQIFIEGNNSYTNATIVSQETANAENWTCQVTPNDAYLDGITKQNSTIINQNPTIPFVASIANINPVEGSITEQFFTITMNDADGVDDLNNNSVTVNFTKSGEAQRNSTCSVLSGQSTATSNNYTCEIGLQYFDGSGVWNVNVYGEDISGSSALNITRNFVYNELKAIVISPSGLTFNVTLGGANVTSNENTIINNTGNYDAKNISVEGIDLYSGSFTLGVGNFSSAIIFFDLDCNPNLQNETQVNITGASLNAGNLTAGQGQEELFYCLRTSELGGIPSGTYDTSSAFSWTIRILLVAISFKRRKKKLKKDNKLIKALKILASELEENYTKEKETIINLLIKEIKKKYRLNTREISELTIIRKEISIPISIFSDKLGALESIVKYLKENLRMNYKEISELINRDERTIWTAYKKASQKEPKPLKINKKEVKLPIKIYKGKKLTVLESTIKYLREKGLKYSEISKLLKRDQRNIRTIYYRVLKKTKKSL